MESYSLEPNPRPFFTEKGMNESHRPQVITPLFYMGVSLKGGTPKTPQNDQFQ